MAQRRNWSDAEVQEALALYLRTAFGRLHSRNPEIVALAARLGRTPAAVALKLTNLAALDDSLPQKGMANASATDRRVWAGYLSDPSAVLRAFAAQIVAAPTPGLSEAGAAFAPRDAGEREAIGLQRIGQDFFRRMILTSYGRRCALTGLDDPRLLTASHIVPWREDARHRLDPANGLCLNALHDRAFDRHLITFDPDWRMAIRADVPDAARRQLLRGVDGPLRMPERFRPAPALMARHRARFAALAA